MTGHRADSLPADSLAALSSRIRDVLLLLAQTGKALFDTERDCFAEDPPRLRLVSPIADGADQIAAEVALELGWELQVVLPFERSEYRASLADDGARDRFDALMERATCLLELPGHGERLLDAYVMTGRATVAHCDLLIAVWDGLPPRGRGGTGEVVQFAITRGTAVVHLPMGADAPARVLWSAFDPVVLTIADEEAAERPLSRSSMDALLRGLLMPPPSEGIAHAAPSPQSDGNLLVIALQADALKDALALPALAPRLLKLDPDLPLGYPRDLDILPNTLPPERHIGYAVQWFGLAAAVLVTALVLTWRSRRAARQGH